VISEDFKKGKVFVFRTFKMMDPCSNLELPSFDFPNYSHFHNHVKIFTQVGFTLTFSDEGPLLSNSESSRFSQNRNDNAD